MCIDVSSISTAFLKFLTTALSHINFDIIYQIYLKFINTDVRIYSYQFKVQKILNAHIKLEINLSKLIIIK